MAEEKPQQERTEEATPKRREEARKKGDVPRSRELTMAIVMLAGSSSLLLLPAAIGRDFLDAFASALEVDRSRVFELNSMAMSFAETASAMFLSIAPLAIILLLAVFASSALIGGWSFSMKAAAFKAERLNPAKGIKRIFSANSLNELLKAMAKFAVIAVIGVAWLWRILEELLSLGREPVVSGVVHALYLCGLSFLIVCSGLLLIAAVDVPFQLWQYRKKLRMTRHQVKEEFKETEGRPEVKSRIRMLQQQAATRRMMEDVPTADVVITNPTHFAIALKYDDNGAAAPQVVAKGKDLIAARIREIAEQHDVPLFSAPPLARALYRTTKIGQEIPGRLYSAVAQVLAYIFQVRDLMGTGNDLPSPPLIDEEDL